MEFTEGDNDGTITFTNDDTELSFYQTEVSKANRSDLAISMSGFGAALNYIAGLKFLHDGDGKERKKLEEPSRSAVILTDIVYEVYAEKRISFVFSKFTDSNEVILHIEFTDDKSDTDLEAKVTATADDGSFVSLDALLEALGKGDMSKHISVFKDSIDDCCKKLQEKNHLEQFETAFDALENL